MQVNAAGHVLLFGAWKIAEGLTRDRCDAEYCRWRNNELTLQFDPGSILYDLYTAGIDAVVPSILNPFICHNV